MRFAVGRFFPAPLRHGPDEGAAREELIRRQRDVYQQGFESLRDAIETSDQAGLGAAAAEIDSVVRSGISELREAARETGALD